MLLGLARSGQCGTDVELSQIEALWGKNTTSDAKLVHEIVGAKARNAKKKSLRKCDYHVCAPIRLNKCSQCCCELGIFFDVLFSTYTTMFSTTSEKVTGKKVGLALSSVGKWMCGCVKAFCILLEFSRPLQGDRLHLFYLIIKVFKALSKSPSWPTRDR